MVILQEILALRANGCTDHAVHDHVLRGWHIRQGQEGDRCQRNQYASDPQHNTHDVSSGLNSRRLYRPG
jgi:hypothetical protein